MPEFPLPRPFVFAACLIGLSAIAAAAEKQPNIVLIVTDDGGWADFGFNGCKDYGTPNMDRIAKEGVNFTAGYVSGPVCSVSRAGLLTGRYQSRFGHEYNIVSHAQGLPLTETLLPARFKALGYVTGAVGKWHLGGAKGFQPFERGFDYSYGFNGGSRGYYPDKTIKDNDHVFRRNGVPVLEPEYVTDAIGRESVKFIGEQAGKKPFFLYAAFTCPHEPMQAKPGYVEKFPNVAKDRRVLAAMMLSEDEAVGKILDTLKAKGIENDTLVWLINDNGAGTYYHFDNGIWRGRKGSLYEGGVRVAFAARWPGRIPAGQECKRPVISLDIGATSLAVAGSAPVPQLDGVNILPFLQNPESAAKPHETLYWRYYPAAAIRDGDWKLVSMDGKPIGLFNLERDPGEKNNLMDKESARCATINAKLEAWKKGQPMPAWRGDEKTYDHIRKSMLSTQTQEDDER